MVRNKSGRQWDGASLHFTYLNHRVDSAPLASREKFIFTKIFNESSRYHSTE